jgi:hypothetical protein
VCCKIVSVCCEIGSVCCKSVSMCCENGSVCCEIGSVCCEICSVSCQIVTYLGIYTYEVWYGLHIKDDSKKPIFTLTKKLKVIN